MGREPGYKNTRVKLILGFSIITLLAITASITAYNSFKNLEKSVERLSEPNPRLSILNLTLYLITQSENTFREYTLGRDDSLLLTYRLQMDTIQRSIESLRPLVAENTGQLARLDSVSRLWEEKHKSLERFSALKRSAEQFDAYSEVLDKANTDAPKKNEGKKEEISRNTRPAETETPGRATIPLLFRKFKKPVLGYLKGYFELKKTSENVVEIEELQTILDEVKGSQDSKQEIARLQELELLRKNSMLTDKIRSIISELEHKERQVEMQNVETVNAEVQSASQTLVMLTASALVLSIIFVSLVLSDVSRSHYYRKQLTRAKLRAERLSKAKEEFLANMSHEIRTPLNAILGFSEQLSQLVKGHPQQGYLKAIYSSSEHLLSTVNDILDISKIESGKLRFEEVPFSVAQVADEVVAALGIKATEKSLSLESIYEDDASTVVIGDPFRLRQILFNLVNNAIKFTEEGFVEVECNVQKIKEQNLLKCELVVSDTGIGIPPIKQRAIFEDFSQADSSTTRKYGGTGLGLAICKRLTEMQGGQIAVESEEGKGAAFTVSLSFPLAGSEVAAQQQKAPGFYVFDDDLRLLVADDDSLNLQLSQVVLGKNKIQADYASSGREALELFKANHYDLVLTDIQMPEFSGIELTERIRTLQDTGKALVPVVAFTANVIKENLQKFKEAGMTDFLLKPFKEPEMLALVARLTEKGREVSREEAVQALADEPESFEIAVGASLPATFSTENLLKFTGNDPAMVHTLLQSFMKNDRDNIEWLKEAAEFRDMASISSVTHKMLNGYQNLHVTRAVPLLKFLELLKADDVWNAEIEEKLNALLVIASELHQEIARVLEPETVRQN